MKLLLIISLCLLNGCMVPTYDSEIQKSNYKTPSPDQGEWSGSSDYADQCGNPDYIVISVDGVAHWTQVPALCNEGLNLDKGDPAPDAKNKNDYHVKEFSNKESNY